MTEQCYIYLYMDQLANINCNDNPPKTAMRTLQNCNQNPETAMRTPQNCNGNPPNCNENPPNCNETKIY